MSTNNLYLELLDMAAQEHIQLSQQSQTDRASVHDPYPIFTSKLKQLKQKIRSIHLNNERILQYKNRIAYNTLPSSQTELYEQVRIICDKNYSQILELRKLFEELGDVVKENIKENPNEPETHSQMYQKQYIAEQIKNITKQTQNIQVLIQKFSINTSLKRIKALAPDLDDSEAEIIAKKKNGFDQLLITKTLGKASLKMKYRVEDIAQKNQQITKLESIVEENLKLMEEISLMVKQQGQMIDNIRENVLNAKDYIEKVEHILAQQKKQHKKSRKKLCCIIFLAIIILALVVVPIVLTVVNQNKKTDTVPVTHQS